ncbi:hypothetical protein [Streptomyces sp. NPDC057257]|uniref:hypothetical protein n=1 Tax=Streptomyces sp. NPDC057257 TaxID=3346071 RepID=UPI00363C5207
MTVLRTAEPPRLPVRDKAAAAARGWGGVSPMLTRLAAERATGVLMRERGTLHLADGQVVLADSPFATGLDALLTARGVLSAQAWQEALAAAGDRHRAGRRLVDTGRLALGALELCHLTALYDAAYFALAPSSTPGRFRYGTAPGPGVLTPVPVAALERETLRRRDLLHRIWPSPAMDDTPLVRTGLPAAPTLTHRQRQVLAEVDGVRTATDIARRLGHLTFHTLVDVRRLAAAGVLAPTLPAHTEPGRPPSPTELPGLPTRGAPTGRGAAGATSTRGAAGGLPTRGEPGGSLTRGTPNALPSHGRPPAPPAPPAGTGPGDPHARPEPTGLPVPDAPFAVPGHATPTVPGHTAPFAVPGHTAPADVPPHGQPGPSPHGDPGLPPHGDPGLPPHGQPGLPTRGEPPDGRRRPPQPGREQPFRIPERVGAATGPAPGHETSAPTGEIPADPHITLLKRLRDALEAL